MITVIAHHTAAADAVRELLARHAAASRSEPVRLLTLAVEIDFKELT